jgi:DNA-binding NarL/FixJ family response regulator
VTGKAELPTLSGTSVLVIEDEFYLAMEIKEAIERAGGSVLGPCADATTASSEISRGSPDCAIVDINLGYGPSFEAAGELQRSGVPFLFLTGYDAPTIPRQFAAVLRIEKPAATDRVIEAILRLTGR